MNASPPWQAMAAFRFLGSETTGLIPAHGELLEVAVVDLAGTVLLDSLVRPVPAEDWPEAQAIHGITPADVANAPTCGELRPRLAAALAGCEVVAYNAPVDASFVGAKKAAARALGLLRMQRAADRALHRAER